MKTRGNKRNYKAMLKDEETKIATNITETEKQHIPDETSLQNPDDTPLSFENLFKKIKTEPGISGKKNQIYSSSENESDESNDSNKSDESNDSVKSNDSNETNVSNNSNDSDVQEVDIQKSKQADPKNPQEEKTLEPKPSTSRVDLEKEFEIANKIIAKLQKQLQSHQKEKPRTFKPKKTEKQKKTEVEPKKEPDAVDSMIARLQREIETLKARKSNQNKSSSDSKQSVKIEKTLASSDSNSNSSDSSSNSSSASSEDESDSSSKLKSKSKKQKKSKKLEEKPPTSSESSDESNDDDFFKSLNNVTQYTSRDLKLKTQYKCIDIKITKEIGFNGKKYKKATAILEDPASKKKLSVVLPKPVALYNDEQLQELKKKIKKEDYPTYTVKKITQKKRPDGKSTYDFVDFKWGKPKNT